MNNLITISGVSGYIDENGTAMLKLEDVARGLGFTQTAASGNEVVRWERVKRYLEELNSIPTSGDASDYPEFPRFIPENIFYRLAMKAKNETAERFQALVADEILPAIRKHGAYVRKPMSQIEMLAAQAQAMVELEQKANTAIQAADTANKRLTGALDALAAPTKTDWQTDTGNKLRRIAHDNGLSYPVLFGDLYKELEDIAHVNLTARLSGLRKRMKAGGATYAERMEISKLHIISRDPKLKLAFDGIVRRVDAKYAGAQKGEAN